MSGAKNVRFIGRELHKWRDELRNERSANLSLRCKQMEER